MCSILAEFARGNILPDEVPVPRTPAYNAAMQALLACEEELLTRLPDGGAQWLEQYARARQAVSDAWDINRFVTGYRLGVLMTTEVFSGREQLEGA